MGLSPADMRVEGILKMTFWGALASWQGKAIIVAIVGLALGVAIGFAIRQSTVEDLNATVNQVRSDLVGIQSELDSEQSRASGLSSALGSIRDDAQLLRQEISGKDAQLNELQGTKDLVSDLETRVKNLSRQLDAASVAVRRGVAGLANDRLLLADMRKDAPQRRDEAVLHWQNIKDLAVKSAPSLGSSVEKVTKALPAYFNWAEREFATTEESRLTYLLTGAAGYDSSADEFWQQFLLVVINRLDILVGLAS